MSHPNLISTRSNTARQDSTLGITMHFSPELLAGIAGAILVLIIFITSRKNRGSPKNHPRTVSRGPSNLKFVCKGCSNPFAHSKRTVGAYEKGARSFFCNSCHAKWRESNPSKTMDSEINRRTSTPITNHPTGNKEQPTRASRDFNPSSAKSGNGCLGATLLLIAVPIALISVAAKYI